MAQNHKRYSVRIEGIVQGVGFRPFVYRLATESGLSGWVLNDNQGVLCEVEGSEERLESFCRALRDELPPLASISGLQVSECALQADAGFQIVRSRQGALQTAQVSPDSHVCPDCLRELFDTADRRYRYPFINCTNCGPRYSIVCEVPYDRSRTTMVDFPMCAACSSEYDDPASRRFHAQPNACPDCGPALSLYDRDGLLLGDSDPLGAAISALKAGQVVAVKGLGGYHLAVDAQNQTAVASLRQRKLRDEKPFALMTHDVGVARGFVQVGDTEARLLESVERPIVLLEQRPGQRLVCDQVAPANRYFGVMLPYTPLHYLLLADFTALVMTSGNQSDEPIVYNDCEAFERLSGIADLFLGHDRRIHIRTDDSIARVLDGQPLLLRRSRGYVPRAVKLPRPQPSVLAYGAELKSCACLTSADRATMSHHIGDLKSQPVLDSLQQATDHLQQLLDVKPELIAHDLHPDYLSTAAALQRGGGRTLAVQHHHAHLASCLADNGREEPAIGVIFDGVGYGSDGHIWGGEFLVGDYRSFERLGHLDGLPMPGGDAATREPWRMAFSLLYSVYGSGFPRLPIFETIPSSDLRLLQQMIDKQINCPLTSSCGRLFDAVSALCAVRQHVSYEGQAALELEMKLDSGLEAEPYPFEIVSHNGLFCGTYHKLVDALVADLEACRPVAAISKAFHLGLAELIVSACARIRSQRGELPVVLSGGVFQNVYLTETTSSMLRSAGFEVLLHRQVPPNDGGLALGQAVIAGASLQS